MRLSAFVPIISALVLCASFAQAQEKLVIVGGGDRPVKAMKQFGEWTKQKARANQDRQTLLIITWASEGYPVESGEALTQELAPHYKGQIEISLLPPKTPEARAIFLEQLARAGGVFFSGGDQSRIMDVLASPEGKEIRQQMEEMFASGTPFGGTSAGTAIMSHPMINGYGNTFNGGPVPMSEGLGFLSPRGADEKSLIVDQHFTQRGAVIDPQEPKKNRISREERLTRAMKQMGISFGVGIDEDTALLIEDRQRARIVGKHNVRLFVSNDGLNTINQTWLDEGDRIDLVERKVISVGPPGKCESTLLPKK